MRLLVIVNVYYPDRAGGAAVYTDLVRTLARRGFEITVRAPYPFYPEWRDKSGRNGMGIWRYREEGVSVERFGLYIPRNPRSLPQRLLYELSFFFSLLRSAFSAKRFDAIMAFSPLVGGVAAAVVLGALSRTSIWLNVQDISADASATAGITSQRWLTHIFSKIEGWLFNRASVWSTISPVMRDRLMELRTRAQPILYLPNWAGISLQEAIAKQPPRRPPAANAPLRLLYAGNIGQKQNLLAFCRALEGVRTPIEMRIFGSGACAREVEEWVRDSGDSRFTFGPLLPEDAFAAELNRCDLYVITEMEGAGGSFIPSKLVSGMLAGAAILVICDPTSPLGREALAAGAGPHIVWSDLARLDDILSEIRQNSEQLQRWQNNAIARAALYDRERIIDHFEQGLREFGTTGTVDQTALDGTLSTEPLKHGPAFARHG